MDILARTTTMLKDMLGICPDFGNPVEVIDFITKFDYTSLNDVLGEVGIDRPFAQYNKCKLYRNFDSPPKIQSFCTCTGPIVFGKNVRVGPYCFLRGPLIIGDNVLIGPYAEITRTVVLNDAVLAHRNSIMDSIIGERVELAGFVYICNINKQGVFNVSCGGKKKIRREGRFGATIDSDVYVGAAAGIMPGTYIPAGAKYPGPCIIYGPGKHRWDIPFPNQQEEC